MAFDKDYPNRKDWRTPYYDAKSFDRSCRNHKSCSYCKSNRLHKHRKKVLAFFFEERYNESILN